MKSITDEALVFAHPCSNMLRASKAVHLLGVLLLLAVGCGGKGRERELVELQQQTQTSADVSDSECTAERPGCSCVDGSAPVACYDKPKRRDAETLVCGRGTMSCRGGKWSSCESLSTFERRVPAEQPRELGAGANLLISPPTKCNPCDPTCFAAVDRPVDGDLTANNSSEAQYDADEGGVRLKVLVDAINRGSSDETAVCGDGTLGGVELCDDGNRRNGDGCGRDCRLEDGWACPQPGQACHRSVCGDRTAEGNEQCDDGNLQIGDGCTPFCMREPSCANGSCAALCGDGKVMPGEACDDGNTRDGDGCSSACVLERGFRCEVISANPPAHMDLPIVYRDFKKSHPDFQHWCCGMDPGMVETTWGADRKPVPVISAENPSLSSAANFNEWYNDSSANMTYADVLRVVRQPNGTYVFDSNAFFPLDGRGFATRSEPQYDGRNFHFTSEVRFWFQYVPGQKLTFRGDDDVWVFINGKLAVDLGGVHGATAGSVTLDASTADSYGLTANGLYEAAVFQAERHTTQSNYRLQLGGFFFGRTQCESVCGDGIVTPDEICDDGANNGQPGGCLPNCQGRLRKLAASGRYWREYDATTTCAPSERPKWGTLTWSGSAPGQTSIQLELRTAPNRSALNSARPVVLPLPNNLEAGTLDVGATLTAAGEQKNDPSLRVTAVLGASPDLTQSPVLRELSLKYTCIFAE